MMEEHENALQNLKDLRQRSAGYQQEAEECRRLAGKALDKLDRVEPLLEAAVERVLHPCCGCGAELSVVG